MVVELQITQTLTNTFTPEHLEVFNESGMHNVPPGSETHFRVLVVSSEFQEKNLVQRHRMINTSLADLLKGPVHALAIQAFSPEEWAAREQGPAQSPPCLGGSASEHS
jgi:BolA protein